MGKLLECKVGKYMEVKDLLWCLAFGFGGAAVLSWYMRTIALSVCG